MTEKDKPVIFISHISEEKNLAYIFKKYLSGAFLELVDFFVSSDGESIELGKKWLDEVDNALKKAEIEIVLCSKISVRKPWINFEAGAGWIRGIDIIPICHTDMQKSGLPVPLSMLQGINANDELELRLLVKTISEILGSSIPDLNYSNLLREITQFEEEYKNSEEVQISEPLDVGFVFNDNESNSGVIVKLTNLGTMTIGELEFYISFSDKKRIKVPSGFDGFHIDSMEINENQSYKTGISSLNPGESYSLSPISIKWIKDRPISATIAIARIDKPFIKKRVEIGFFCVNLDSDVKDWIVYWDNTCNTCKGETNHIKINETTYLCSKCHNENKLTW